MIAKLSLHPPSISGGLSPAKWPKGHRCAQRKWPSLASLPAVQRHGCPWSFGASPAPDLSSTRSARGFSRLLASSLAWKVVFEGLYKESGEEAAIYLLKTVCSLDKLQFYFILLMPIADCVFSWLNLSSTLQTFTINLSFLVLSSLGRNCKHKMERETLHVFHVSCWFLHKQAVAQTSRLLCLCFLWSHNFFH